jgi:hypothetical protein
LPPLVSLEQVAHFWDTGDSLFIACDQGIPCGTLRAPVRARHLRENELDLKVSRKIRMDLSNGQWSDKGGSHGSDLKRRHSGSGI